MRLVPAAALCLSLTAQTALACAADAMVVFDASASMNSQDFDANTTRRIDEARAGIRELTRRLGEIDERLASLDEELAIELARYRRLTDSG